MYLRRSERVRPLGQNVAASIDSTKLSNPTGVGKSKQKRGAKSIQTTQSDLSTTKSELTTADGSSTPKRRRLSGPGAISPITPTPTLVNLMNASSSVTGGTNGSVPFSSDDRPVESHRTNAPLSSPSGSRILTYSKELIETSPSKHGVPRPTTTTGNLLGEACQHLIKTDPRLKPVVEKHYCRIFGPEGLGDIIDPFQSLCSGIMAQQVSGAAAKSIKKRFIALFKDDFVEHGDDEVKLGFPTPAQVVACDMATLRTAGLSGRKAEYITGLAEKFVRGELSAELLIKASDEEVMEKLTAVRGLGKWSVEMFSCFALKRMDVFSTGDLGVQRGMAAYMGKDVNRLKAKGGKWKYMSEKEMLEQSAKFAPYRSLFMWYMWRVEDVDVEAVQDNQHRTCSAKSSPRHERFEH